MSVSRSPTAQTHLPAAHQSDPHALYPNRGAGEVIRGHTEESCLGAEHDTVSRYRIIRQLGRGGMGEVYLAEDTKLGRHVAIKFLPEEVAADERAGRRLVREARAAAALDHPNICVIHEVCEEAGRTFIVMQYVEGETLASKMARKQLSPGECLEVATQVAGALADAHSHGIIHRDISPQNIMLTARLQAKVMDFGLAKVVRGRPSADGEAVTERLLTDQRTVAGVVGTVPYMSPEQVRGEGLDVRSDIFSLGAVLYEMVTGRQPFTAGSAAETISSILTEEPAPLARYARGVPAELERIVTKALHKDREDRYQTAGDLLIDLRCLKHHLEVEEELERSLPPATAAAHTGGALGRHGRGLFIATAALASVVATLTYLFYFPTGDKEIDSVAVLPFVNASGDPETDYLSDGITESLINSLSRVGRLRVVARTTAFRYKGKEINPRRVGRELGVEAVLTGRLMQQGDRLTVQVDLVETRGGAQVWGERYERKASDLLAVRRELAREVTENLRLRSGAEGEERVTRGDASNADAYRLYLKGRFFWNKRTPVDLLKSLDYFQRAISRDPNYALAYAGLADCYNVIPSYGVFPPRVAMPRAKEAAQKALEIDNTLAEAHAALGYSLAMYDWDWAAAEREFKRAIELDPNYPTARYFYALTYLIPKGRLNEAIAEMKKAQEHDPLSPILNTNLGWAYYYSRDYDQAIEQLRKTLEIDPNFENARLRLAESYVGKGMYAEAVEESQKGANWAVRGYVYAVTGRRAEARRMIDGLREWSGQSYVSPYYIAIIHEALGERERAFEYLQNAFDERDWLLPRLMVDPALDGIRPDPRYADLVRRVGLPQLT